MTAITGRGGNRTLHDKSHFFIFMWDSKGLCLLLFAASVTYAVWQEATHRYIEKHLKFILKLFNPQPSTISIASSQFM